MATIANPFYEQQRAKAQQAVKTQEDEQLQALRRRLAALGGFDSGAGIKMEQKVKQQAGQQLAGQLQDISAQEAQYNLAQQEAEKQRQFQAEQLGKQLGSQKELQTLGQQFQAGESALGRAAAEKQLGTQLSAQEKLQLLGQQFQAGESAQERSLRQSMQVSDQDFQKIQSSLGRDAAQKLQDSANSNALRLQELNSDVTKLGYINQQKLTQMGIDSAEKLDGLKLAYQTAKDASDRAILEKQMKNELTFGLMSQAGSFAEAAKLGLAPSELASMMSSFMGDAIGFNPDGTINFNKNWNPTGTSIAASPTYTSVGLQTSYGQPSYQLSSNVIGRGPGSL